MSGAATLNAEQAGAVLGVTGRRIRQLVDKGILGGTREADGTLRLDAGQVRAYARKRRAGKARTSTGSGRPAAGTDLEAVLSAVLERTVPAAVAAATDGLREDLRQERAARQTAEAQILRLRQQLAGQQGQPPPDAEDA